MTTEEITENTGYPEVRDPRVMVAVPRERRAAMGTLWAFAERLTKLLTDAREPLIGQIKLAWWRDMAAILARDPDGLPKGEPLLAELTATWSGQGGLETLVDAAEAMLLAEDVADRRTAAADFGARLFALSGGDADGGRRWGLLWGAFVQPGAHEARALLAAARACAPPPRSNFGSNRALLMLDRWAAAIAKNDGERRWRSEGLLLFRLGLIGR
jgi:phytoene synthase